MNESTVSTKKLQSLTQDEFFYFFLRMRKSEVTRIVDVLRSRFPDESPEQLAKRLVASKWKLALLGGTLVNVPGLIPGVGASLKLAGVVGGTSMLTRMNLYLINEIAMVFGEDVDDRARISDMMAVVGATAVSSTAPGYVGQWLGLSPWALLPAGALSSAATTKMIGLAAIRHFQRRSLNREYQARNPAPAQATTEH